MTIYNIFVFPVLLQFGEAVACISYIQELIGFQRFHLPQLCTKD